MENKFVQEIKEIEQEILALKTASEYTSVRSANFTSAVDVYTGLYQINFGGNNEQIFSIVGANADYDHGSVYPRTPSGNSQVVEVISTYYAGGSYVTENISLSIVSNRPVTSVQRL